MPEIETKICGVCRPVDAAAAAAAGADYIGVVLAPGLRRSQSARSAAEVFAAAPGRRRVGVFVDASLEELVDTAAELDLDVLQLHGAESPELAAAARAAGAWQVWKALRPRSRAELMAGVDAFAGSIDGVLLDGWSAGGVGGTGTRLPWPKLATVRGALPPALRLVLAGGLTPENVAEAAAWVRPEVVDVSSGVEHSVGEKSAERVRAFVAAARAAAAAPPGQAVEGPA